MLRLYVLLLLPEGRFLLRRDVAVRGPCGELVGRGLGRCFRLVGRLLGRLGRLLRIPGQRIVRVLRGLVPIRSIESACLTGFDAAHHVARGPLHPQVAHIVRRCGLHDERPALAVGRLLRLGSLPQRFYGVAVRDQGPFVGLARLHPPPRLARIGSRLGVDVRLRVGEGVALVLSLLAVSEPRGGRIVLQGRSIGVEPVLHHSVELFVDPGELPRKRVVDVVLRLLSLAGRGIRRLLRRVGCILGVRGRLLDRIEVELFLETSRGGIVDFALHETLLGIVGDTHAGFGRGQKQRLRFRVDDERAVEAPHKSLQVDVVQIGRITRHLKPEEGEIREVSELCGDILPGELPVGDVAQITLVGARRVARRAARSIREGAVGYELHRIHRGNLTGIPLRHGPQFVAEALVPVAQHFRDAEIGRGESREGSVAPAVVLILRGILRGDGAVEDTHADVARLDGSDFALFELERYELLGRIRFRDDASARGGPVVPDGNIHPVVVQRGNGQRFAHRDVLKLGVAGAVDQTSETRQTRSEVAEDGSFPKKEVAFDSSAAPAIEEFPFALPRGIDRRVACGRLLPRADQIGVLRRDEFHGMPNGFDVVFDARDKPRGPHGADLDAHFVGIENRTRNANDAAVVVTRLGKVLFAEQPHPLPGAQHEPSLLDIDVVERRLVYAHVASCFRGELLGGLQELLFRQGIVFVRHADIPQDVFISGFGFEQSARQLRIVVIGPLRDDFEHACVPVGVVVDFEFASCEFAGLKRYALYETRDLIVVRVERQRSVVETIDVVGVALVVLSFGPKHGIDLSDIARIDVFECLRLDQFTESLFGVHVDARLAAGQLQPVVAVFLGVDVSGRTHRVEVGIRTKVVGHRTFDLGGQSASVSQFDGFSELAAAQIECDAVRPVFGPARFGQLCERFGTALARVVDLDILRGYDLADLPLGRGKTAVDVCDDERHVFACRRREHEQRTVGTVRGVEHERLRQKRFDTSEGEVVFPFGLCRLLGFILLRKPKALAVEHHPISGQEQDALFRMEREREPVVFHDSPVVRRIFFDVRSQLHRARAVVYLQFIHCRIGFQGLFEQAPRSPAQVRKRSR